VPSTIGMEDTIRVKVTNAGANAISRTVYLQISGANSILDSASVSALAAGASTTLSFTSSAALNRNNLGNNTIKAYIGGDDNAANDTATATQIVSANAYNYGDLSQGPLGGVGFNGTDGEFGAKFYVNGANSVNQIKVYLTNNALPYSIVVYNSNGTNGAPGTIIWRSQTYLSSVGVNVVNVVDSATQAAFNANVTGMSYVGVRQMSTTNIGFGYQDENPIRSGSFFFRGLASATWTDFSTTGSNFKFMVEPRLKVAYDLGVSALTQPTCIESGAQTITFQVKNLGANTYDFATDSVTIYGYAVAPNGVRTNFSPVSVSTGTLASNGTMDITVSNNYNMTLSGDYHFNAYTVASLDLNGDNDSLPSGIIKNIGILSQPTSTSACQTGGSTSISVSAQGIGVTYQWYYGTGGSFATVPNGSTFSGATTATLGINSPSFSLNGYKFFCLVTNACPAPVNTDTVNLTVYAPSNGGTATVNNSVVCAGQKVNLAVTGYTGTLQWQKNTGSGWVNFGTPGNDTLNNVVVNATTQFRAIALSGSCSSQGSNILTVSVGGLFNAWTGAGITNNWNNKFNWCSGALPTSGVSVSITANALINSAASCNNMTINTGDTLFITSGGNLTINGDLTINGALVMTAGTITFTKAGTCIPSATYHQMRICAPGTVYACGNFTVNNNLIICNGTTFNDTGYVITVRSNIDNNGVHVSRNTGKLNLNNSSFTYTLTGTATYGNMDVTAAGLRLGTTGILSAPILGNTLVTGTLNMNQGSISLNNSTLTIGSTTSTTGQLNNSGNGLILGSAGATLNLLGASGAAFISNLRLSNVENVTINRANGVSLGSSSNILGTLSLVSGRMNQNGYNLVIGNTGSALGAVGYTTGFLNNSASSGYLYLNGNSSAGVYTLKADTLNGFGMFSPNGLTLGSNLYIRTGATLSSGDFNLNSYGVTISPTGFISESAGQNFKGSGTLTTTRTYSTALSNNNIAGMGLTITSASAPGNVTLVRAHTPQINGSNSGIARYYDLTIQNAVSTTKLDIAYDSTELNGNVRGRLRINRSNNGGTTWSSITGCSPTTANAATGNVGKYAVVSLSGSMRLTASDSLNSLSPVFETSQEAQTQSTGSISTWPNPFTSSFTAELDMAAGQYQITLMDMNGRVIENKQVEVQNGKVQLSVSGEGLSSGVYLLNVQGNGSNTNLKVVKQ